MFSSFLSVRWLISFLRSCISQKNDLHSALQYNTYLHTFYIHTYSMHCTSQMSFCYMMSDSREERRQDMSIVHMQAHYAHLRSTQYLLYSSTSTTRQTHDRLLNKLPVRYIAPAHIVVGVGFSVYNIICIHMLTNTPKAASEKRKYDFHALYTYTHTQKFEKSPSFASDFSWAVFSVSILPRSSVESRNTLSDTYARQYCVYGAINSGKNISRKI